MEYHSGSLVHPLSQLRGRSNFCVKGGQESSIKECNSADHRRCVSTQGFSKLLTGEGKEVRSDAESEFDRPASKVCSGTVPG